MAEAILTAPPVTTEQVAVKIERNESYFQEI